MELQLQRPLPRRTVRPSSDPTSQATISFEEASRPVTTSNRRGHHVTLRRGPLRDDHAPWRRRCCRLRRPRGWLGGLRAGARGSSSSSTPFLLVGGPLVLVL